MQPEHASTARIVLVVEQDHDTRVQLRELLEASGYMVVSCANGKAALELLDGGGVRPDVILLDMRTPVMDGWQVVQALRQRSSLEPLPVIVHASEEEPLPEGISFVLHKPIDPAALLTALRAQIG